MNLDKEIMQSADAMKEALIERRRDLHRHPEPGWTEFRTASIVATTLESIGYEVITGEEAIAKGSMMGLPSADVLREAAERAASEGAEPRWLEHMKGGLTGVVGMFRFAKPGPVVALRFDMDSNDVDDTSPTYKALEEGSATQSKEEIITMAARQQKFIQGLKAALVRIENKTYGIDRLTGKLIPKERLRAVPHATLSVESKMMEKK